MTNVFARAHEIAQRHRHAKVSVLGKVPPLFATTDEKRAALYVYEVIGEDWWTGGGVTGKRVAEALKELNGVEALDIYINSEGGDVFEAKAIYTQLKRFKAEKVVHVDGLAASAATLIAMAGDRIITSPVATWMVHEAWSIALGRAEDMRAMADLLDLENMTLAETYAARTGKPVDEMRELMRAETWMSAVQAKELGFTDEIAEDESEEDEDKVEAKVSPLILGAERTQERLRAASKHDVAVIRHARRLKELSTRASPAKRNGQP